MNRHIARCPVCEGESFKPIRAATFSGHWRDAIPFFLTNRVKAVNGRILRCECCGFVLTSPQFAVEDYGRIYAAVHQATAGQPPRPGATTRFAALAERVRRRETKPGHFLDFGCGRGEFLDCMTGFDGIGLEISAGEATRQGRILSCDILTAQVEELAPASYDFIVAWDVLEHLSDPVAYLRRLNQLLKPGGRLYLTAPNQDSWVARLTGGRWNLLLLEHLWYFAPGTVTRFLKQCGFVTEEVSSIGFPVDLATLGLRIGQTYGAWFPPMPRWLGRIVVNLPIGLMFVVARKQSVVEP